jgi:hypothetical protein
MTATALYEQYMGFGDDPFIPAAGSERRTSGLLSLGICQGTVRGYRCCIATGRLARRESLASDVTAQRDGPVTSTVGIKLT